MGRSCLWLCSSLLSLLNIGRNQGQLGSSSPLQQAGGVGMLSLNNGGGPRVLFCAKMMISLMSALFDPSNIK
jgi:hypothetical protein